MRTLILPSYIPSLLVYLVPSPLSSTFGSVQRLVVAYVPSSSSSSSHSCIRRQSACRHPKLTLLDLQSSHCIAYQAFQQIQKRQVMCLYDAAGSLHEA